VGPLALEAALLLDVVADRLESMKQRPTASEGAAQSAEGDSAARCPECGSIPGASCTACPLCRFLALLRGERPEATAKLVEGALMIIRTLRSLVPEQPTAASGASTTDPPPPPPPARKGGLEHIDIL
jgi:hypothetical protein